MPDLNPRGLYRLARHAVVFEYQTSTAAWRDGWRAGPTRAPDDVPFSYARSVTPVMWLWIFASAAEIPLAHVLLPWESARLVLLHLGIWGLAWMVGLLASLYVHPHLLGPAGLRGLGGPGDRAAQRAGLPHTAGCRRVGGG